MKYGGARIQEFWQQRPDSWNFQRLLLVKNNQISQVQKFNALLWMGRWKNLGSLKPFLWYVPHLLGLVSCVFTFWVSSRLTIRSGYSLMAIRWQVFFSSHQLSIGGGCNCSWLWHPLFTDMAGNTPFLSTKGTLFRKKKACNEGD